MDSSTSSPGNRKRKSDLSDSDIENFTKNILERAKQRLQILDPTGAKTLTIPSEMKTITEPSISDNDEEENYSVDVSTEADESEIEKSELVGENIQRNQKRVAFNENLTEETENSISTSRVLGTGRTSRLAALATTINNWENDNDVEESYSGDVSTEADESEIEKSELVGENIRRKQKRVANLTEETENSISTSRVLGTGRTSRLAALASTINNWEDDLTHCALPTSRFYPKSPPKSTNVNRLCKLSMEADSPPENANVSRLALRADSPPKTTNVNVSLKADISPPKNTNLSQLISTKADISPPKKLEPAFAAMKQAKALSDKGKPPKIEEVPQFRRPQNVSQQFEQEMLKPPQADQEKGVSYVRGRPSCVVPKGTVQNHRKLFENNPQPLMRGPFQIPKGTVQNQRNMFEVSGGFKRQTSSSSITSPVSPRAKSLSPVRRHLQERANNLPKYMFGESPVQENKVEKEAFAQNKVGGLLPPPPPPMPTYHSPRARSLSPVKTPKESPASSSSPSRQRITPKRCASPQRSSTSPKSKYPGLSEVKKIRVNEPKEGRIYPSLTDIECTTEADETETEGIPYEDDDMDLSEDSAVSIVSGLSLGTHIERVAKESSPVRQGQTPRRNIRYRPTEDFYDSLARKQINAVAMIDDALEGQDCTLDTVVESQLQAQASSTPNTQQSLSDSSATTSTVTVSNWQITTEIQKLSHNDEGTLVDKVEGNSKDDHTVLGEENCENVLPKPKDGLVLLETEIDSVFNIDEENLESKSTTPTNNACGPKEIANPVQQDSEPISTSSPLVYRYDKQTGVEEEQEPPQLLHTVSFYRKQQTPLKTTETPKRAIQPIIMEESPSPVKDRYDVESINETVKKLEDEVAIQQSSIGEVSKALNLCKATLEFSDSTENVECERILLVATQKRMALLNEIHRLKTEGVLRQHHLSTYDSSPSCRGNMTINRITVPLKRDFISLNVSNTPNVFHFICLVKYREQVEASELISLYSERTANELRFKNIFKIHGLQPEFQVNLEVYCLQSRQEFLPHEAKYHIKKVAADIKSKFTPKKLLSRDVAPSPSSKTLARPFQSSPAGPDAVRTTNFNLCGFIRVDISTLQRNRWTLDGVKYTSALEGSAMLDIKCCAESSIEHRGFLTLFDDIAGFGAWNRRWCVLNASRLDYWKYPDDETKQVPLGSIQLNSCITNRVGPASREICARANTFLLVTTREPEPGDKETLTMSCRGDYTAIKHLITSDTKEEREIWCKQINKVLANIRAWDPNATRVEDCK